jgi:hypothetical protein
MHVAHIEDTYRSGGSVRNAHESRSEPTPGSDTRMTREEEVKCVEDNCDACKKGLLAKASKIPPNWDSMEIRQWVMDCAKDAWVSKMDKTRMHHYQMANRFKAVGSPKSLGLDLRLRREVNTKANCSMTRVMLSRLRADCYGSAIILIHFFQRPEGGNARGLSPQLQSRPTGNRGPFSLCMDSEAR